MFSILIILGIVAPLLPCFNAAKIAIATQGKAEDMEQWTKLMSAMTTRNRINLLILSYDKPVDPNLCSHANGIHCSFKNRSTWTSGRNELTRNIAHHEIVERHHFKYWLFSNGDLSFAICDNKSCESLPKAQAAAATIALPITFCLHSLNMP